MAWYDDLEGRINGVMDVLETREKDRRAKRVERRRRAALFATPMRRMTALLIDVVILYVVLGTLLSFLTELTPLLDLNRTIDFANESEMAFKTGRADLPMIWHAAWAGGHIQRFILNEAIQLFLLGAAVVPALWRWQCTIGMRLTGLRLRLADRSGKPSFLRCLGFFLAGIGTIMTGYLTMVFTTDRRALHDLLSGTAVLRKKEIKERDAMAAMLAADAAAEAEILAQAQAKLQARAQT